MKFEYLKDLRGPNGERFGEEPVDFRAPLAGEWFVTLAGTVEKTYTGRKVVGPRLILRPPHPSTVNSEPEYEEIPVYASEHGWQIAGEWLPAHWASRTDFGGAVYEHPNGHWQVISLTCPVFVHPDHKDKSWNFSFCDQYGYTHMIRPVAIRRKLK